jgi:lysophospholipase L1-like esterase
VSNISLGSKSVGRRGAVGLLVVAVMALAALLPANAMAVAAGDSYVALGDSYTAGPGIPPPDTEGPAPAGCLRSRSNYPHTVATDLHLELKDVSCSGAKTDDMTNSQDTTGNPPPQFEALATDTDLVSFTIGGNDIGFTEISTKCASPTNTGTPCQDQYVKNGHDIISQRIKDTAPKVAAVLDGIRSRSPNAKILVVNYLPILPDKQPKGGKGCWPTVPVTDPDALYLRNKEVELNTMLATQAAAKGATLVNGYKAGIGHDACASPSTRWVEPQVAPVGAAPLHPNKRGMDGYAKTVEAALK